MFPFGKQVDARDLRFSGVKDESRFGTPRKGASHANRSRSGKMLQLCYNLRSVEKASFEVDLPWSIRQTAVYQTLDIETGQAFWIILKGNMMMKKRITEACEDPSWASTTSPSKALATVLSTHLHVCDWSGESWRWYINDLEQELNLLTGNVLANDIDKNLTPKVSPLSSEVDLNHPPVRSRTLPSFLRSETLRNSKPTRAATDKVFTRPKSAPEVSKVTQPLPVLDTHAPAQRTANSPQSGQIDYTEIATKHASNFSQKLWSLFGHGRTRDGQSPLADSREIARLSDVEKFAQSPTTISTLVGVQPQTTFDSLDASGNEKKFTFGDLQRIEFLEEKTQEVNLVLRQNTEVLEELRQHYQTAISRKEFPTKLKNDCQDDLARFDDGVVGVKKNLQRLQLRTETFLHLLQNRKNLLLNILQYRSMRASELLTKRAQVSADNMEHMTTAMCDVAYKTEQETIAMRAITFVTLFFLPATFIATFMSTDILRFENGRRQFEIGGLRVYLSIAMPLTLLTFVVWFIIYQLAKPNGRHPLGRRSMSQRN
ncbi:hypothetical protein J1614_006384 [Plenodomus biglobosus]|nr:hypothetical protein J1614_006384 [Plenodomus biglobosus]